MSPLAPTHEWMKKPCEWYAATQKHGKYDASFVGTNYFFSAMIFETLGGVNAEGEEVLRMLFRFAAKRLGREFTSYCSVGKVIVQFTALSCPIHACSY